MQAIRASIVTSLLILACAQAGPGPLMEPTIPLEANVPLPTSWLEQRPELGAAVVERHQSNISLYLQVGARCNSGIHAHLRQRADTIRMVAHYGLNEEEQEKGGCFGNAVCPYTDSCPTLYRYVISRPPGQYLVEVFLVDSLLTSRVISVGQ